MHIQFAELPVFDQDRAKKFYIDHFDCRVAADEPMGANGWRWIELRFAGARLHFISQGARTRHRRPSQSSSWWTIMSKRPSRP